MKNGLEAPIRVLELRSVFGTGGGPEKTILLGTARTDASAFDITVCYLRAQVDPAYSIDERARALGIKYVEIAERASLDPAIWRKLGRVVQETSPQILHAHDYKTNLLAWLLTRRYGGVPLSTVHGWTGHSARERLLYYPLDKRLLSRFRRVIAVSGEIKAELVRCGAVAERVTIVLNGIDDRSFLREPSRVPIARAQFGLGPQAIAIGSVGRLEPQKRFDLLLEAFARVRLAVPDAVLLIAGDGSQRARLEADCDRLQLGPSCRLLGHVADVATFHHALDLFVQSSDYEGTPNAVLEAMAFETPVVATDAGGTEELIAHPAEGLIVPRGAVAPLAEAIIHSLGDRAAALGRAKLARRQIEEELSFDRRMHKVEQLYRELVRS